MHVAQRTYLGTFVSCKNCRSRSVLEDERKIELGTCTNKQKHLRIRNTYEKKGGWTKRKSDRERETEREKFHCYTYFCRR